jgi:serine O-acetyltransferase
MWLRHQGLWALAEYRFSHWVRETPGARWLLPISHAWHMLIEVTTGISIGARAKIGPGCYIGHFGEIVVNNDVTLGPNCTFNHGVTIGISGHGDERGCPTIGAGVWIGPGAKVFGSITVGDNAQIGANAVVSHDVPAGALVGGVPAKVIRAQP